MPGNMYESESVSIECVNVEEVKLNEPVLLS